MIGLCVGVLVAGCTAWAVAGRRETPRAALGTRALDPTSIPWVQAAVDTMIWSGLQNGITNPRELALFVARWVYPVSASGQPLRWPAPSDAPPIYNRIFQRISIRVHWTLANAAENAVGD